ncbi:hypothetical protein [Streptomyces sp. NPDC058751]|uniref:hypothetical protein n=1 Tax=Streptomyces sp. NPDC058751 TaxID=3346623 RepID=UPI003690C7E5
MHRTFPAALALAALALITGCSGDDTGASGADGRQAPGVSADRQLPDSSDEADPDVTDPDAPDGQAGRNQGYSDPATQCFNAIIADLDGSVPSECEGLTTDQVAEVQQALEIYTEGNKRANEMLLDSIG